VSFPRHTARGIVVLNGSILLMERWRGNLHYFSIPGGGIETGESAAEAVAREIKEETTIVVTVERLVIEMRDEPNNHQIFLCTYLAGDPSLPADAPESLHTTPNNRFEPRWIDLVELENISLGYWQPVRRALIEGLKNSFPKTPTIVTIQLSR
jgi:8-oxo-dGTP diphosphatase